MTHRVTTMLLVSFVFVQMSQAQCFKLFSPEVKTEYPSVVYDFLETYLFKIDSLQRKGEYVEQKLRDDKVIFMTGSAADARKISTEMPFEIKRYEEKFYEVSWADSSGHTLLDISFPIQYELLLGKPKVEIEKEFKTELSKEYLFNPSIHNYMNMTKTDDGCLVANPSSNYYVESLSSATYYIITEHGDTIPVFNNADKWHSAANLFNSCINDVDNYSIFFEQNIYGFKKMNYSMPLRQWLGYCQAMKLKTFFAIEEEREDGLKALLIAQSADLGFNHMLSIIIPDSFITNKKTVFKATLNAYIPTQNVKELYHKHVNRPKKRI